MEELAKSQEEKFLTDAMAVQLGAWGDKKAWNQAKRTTAEGKKQAEKRSRDPVLLKATGFGVERRKVKRGQEPV